jgi:hypothetical protein
MQDLKQSYIMVQRFKINLNFETQISKQGRPFRLSGIVNVTTKPQVYYNGMYRHNTIYTFRYLDKEEFFSFEFDYKNEFINKII